MSSAERERSFERLLTFVDAVVAIAMTLLVLPLAELAADVRDGSVDDLLREHKPELWAFVLSFFVICRLWFTQHRVLEHVVAQDTWVARMLMLWLFTIVFIPFPTALLPEAGDQATTRLLYIGAMTVSAGALTAISARVAAKPELRDSDEPPDVLNGAFTFGLLALALVLSLVFPVLSYWPLLLLVLTDNGAALLRRLRSRRAA